LFEVVLVDPESHREHVLRARRFQRQPGIHDQVVVKSGAAVPLPGSTS
jgi:hypothetical protein